MNKLVFEAARTDPVAIASIFAEHGFAVVRSLFSFDRVQEEIRDALERYISETVPDLEATDVIREKDGEAIRNLFRMNDHMGYFDTLGNDAGVLSIADGLVNGKAALRAVQTFNKPAKVGSPVPQHQDNAYFCMAPPDAFTMWVAVDPATEENGPVHYLPGSHTLGSLEHKYSGQPGNSLMMKEALPVDSGRAYRALLDPGDVVFHHCRTVHFSGPNRSGKPRVGMVIPYAGTHIETDSELKAIYKEVSSTVGRNLYH